MQRRIWRTIRLAIFVFALLGSVAYLLANSLQQAQASSGYLMQAESQYPTIKGTAIDSCSLCHTSSIPALNTYGTDFMNNGHSFTAIENLDSDGDGYTNIAEINAHTFPGDRTSKPAPTSTPTQTKAPPTATATRTRTPTLAATATAVPPTATRTAVPATAIPTNTSVPPTVAATATRPLPTATVPALPPPPTNTRPAPSATSTRAPVPPTATPGSARSISYRGVIRQLPGTRNYIGDWRIGDRLVHVTAQTRIGSGGDDGGGLRTGMNAVVQGSLMADGSILARTIIVYRASNSAEHDQELRQKSTDH